MEHFIYSVMEKKRLKELLEAFYSTVHISIQLMDQDGTELLYYGAKQNYCRHFISRIGSRGMTCSQIHAEAGRRAVSIGETYIFSCHSNLDHIVLPLLNGENLYGSVVVGPFLMMPPDSTLVLDLGHRYKEFSLEDLMDLYDDAFDIPVIEPEQVTQVSRLLYYLFASFLIDARERFIINSMKLTQQARISEAIQMFKQEERAEQGSYPVEMEQKLINMVKAGNLDESRELLNSILGYVFLYSGNNLETIKNRVVELCSLLSRAIIESGAPTDLVFKINNDLLKRLPEYTSLEDICYSANEILQEFVESAFPNAGREGARDIREALSYISGHYSEPITLQDAADKVHLSTAYFSRRFRDVCGVTFKEYLTNVRVEEAKRLLRNTDYSLLDIAIATGFDNQSYFTKVFRKYTGLTPKQFRSMI